MDPAESRRVGHRVVDVLADHLETIEDRAVYPDVEPDAMRRRFDEPALGRIRREAVRRIETEGRFWFGTTVMKDRWWFRINPVNFRTRVHHMEELFETLQRVCREVVSAHAGSG